MARVGLHVSTDHGKLKKLSATSAVLERSGDNVMAELQNKLKGRQKISPTHSSSSSPNKMLHSHKSSKSSKAITSSPILNTSVTTVTDPHSISGSSSDTSHGGESVKVIKLRLENTSSSAAAPETKRESRGEQFQTRNGYHPAIITTQSTATSNDSTAKGKIPKSNEKESTVPSTASNSTASLHCKLAKGASVTTPTNISQAAGIKEVPSLSPTAVTGKGAAAGVKELARIFSARSKDSSVADSSSVGVFSRKTVPKGTASWSTFVTPPTSVTPPSAVSGNSVDRRILVTDGRSVTESADKIETSKGVERGVEQLANPNIALPDISPIANDTTVNSSSSHAVKQIDTVLQSDTAANSGTNLGSHATADIENGTVQDSDSARSHWYQNVFDKDWTPPANAKAKPAKFPIEKTAKRPMPTPRKLSPVAPQSVNSETDMRENEEESEEYYELVQTFSTDKSRPSLDTLQSELKLLEEITELPPLGPDTGQDRSVQNEHSKIVKSQSNNVDDAKIKRRNTPRLLKELRRGVVTDTDAKLRETDEDEEGYISMSSLDILTQRRESNKREVEDSQYYLPVLSKTCSTIAVVADEERESVDEQYMTMRHPSHSSSQHQPPPTSHTPTRPQRLSTGHASQPSPPTEKKRQPLVPPTQLGTKQSGVPSRFQASRDPEVAERLTQWKRSQGSIFAQEMITFMDDQESLYCKVPSNGKRLNLDAIVREDSQEDTESQSYIDVYDIPAPKPVNSTQPVVVNWEVAPPVPNRPLTGPAAPKQSVTSNAIFTSASKTTKESETSRVIEKLSPPLLPPKSESLLREQQITSSQPSPPVSSPLANVTKKAKSGKKLLRTNKSSPAVTAISPVEDTSSSSGSNVKNLIRALKKETFSPGSPSNDPKGNAHKGDHAPRRPLPLPVVKRESSSNIRLTDFTSLDSHTEHSSSSPNLFSHTPPVSTSLSPPTGHRRPYKESLNDTGADVELKRGAVRRRRKQCADISNKINRDSLAVILHNRDIITDQLKQRSLRGGAKIQRPLTDELQPQKGKETLIRSLGQILLEISELIGGESLNIEESSLISTIERELHIKLEPNPSYVGITGDELYFPETTEDVTTPTSYSWSPNDSRRVSVLTDRDVKEVVKYFDDCCRVEDYSEDVSDFLSREHTSLFRSQSHELLDATSSDDPAPIPRSSSVSSLRYRRDDDPSDDSDFAEAMVTQSVTSPVERILNGPKEEWSGVGSGTAHSSNGVGYFTSSGGTLTNRDSAVIVEIPAGAIPKGRRQKLWLEVQQTVYRESDEEELYSSLCISNRINSASDNKDEKKKEPKVQLSPIVSIGPSDAVLHKPLKINIPHCVPADTSPWHLKVTGRGHSSRSDEWMSLTHVTSHFIPRRRQNKKSYKNSTYQLHPNYARVKTRLPGCFRLVGRPVAQNPNKVIKQMVCSIYTEQQQQLTVQQEGIQHCVNGTKVKVFFINAIFDSVEALDKALTSEGYVAIEKNIPFLFCGNQTDMEVSISVDTDPRIHYTQVIPYGTLWRATRVGHARVTFDLSRSNLTRSTKLLTLTANQSDREAFEIEFMLPS